MSSQLAVAALAAVSIAGASAAAQPPAVRLHQGELTGLMADGYEVFLGVPYAAPPTGPLRWRAPQPAPAWRGVRPAVTPGPACIQTAGASGYHGPQSEDCLSVNLYVPGGLRRGARAPVMVWVHGGGFTGGAGSGYDGAQFAKDGVILVTLNYRLGRLGFFAHPAIAATSPDGDLADFGLMDQVAALRWVRDNIAAFGGDPGKVTLFGESAGGQSVDVLLVSPVARGLFARAISESSFAGFPFSRLDQARTAALAYAHTLGVADQGAAGAAALRAMPASAFTKPADLTDPAAPRPVLDGVMLARNPLAAFDRGEQTRVPVIIGGNSFEASEFASFVAAAPKAVIARLGGDAVTVIANYGGEPVRAAADYLTFSQVIEPDRRMARDDARLGVPAWTYYFSYTPASIRSQTIGAWHGAEIGYVFGTLPKTAHDARPQPLMPKTFPAAAAQDEALSRAVHAYWVAFAKTGRPEPAGEPAWPGVKPGADPTMEFGADGPEVRAAFQAQKLDAIEAASRAAAAAKPQAGPG
ncbi:MAG TPA: carboxylesterase family protein [Caulobacteraceae bacterium]|jgi:para-nitrobenzyl esterase|nr:carboxylesterase family protein [Caulobacteraceae bacterium]